MAYEHAEALWSGPPVPSSTAPRAPRVALLSLRRLAQLANYSLTYEFEDVVARLTGADVIAPVAWRQIERSRRTYRAARMLSGSPGIAAAVAPRRYAQEAPECDLFLAVVNDSWDIYALSSLRHWRRRCTYAACYVHESWAHKLPYDYLLELFAPFDEVFLGTQRAVDALQRRTGRSCQYLAHATDVIRFAPYPNPPRREIGLCNIGRRSEITHTALMKMTCDNAFFYYYDTVLPYDHGRTFKVEDPAQHRLLLASLLKRSRYYIANRARVGDPLYSGAAQELSARFFEGASAGAVMLGLRPDSDNFRRQFDWPDAVFEMPFDCADAAERIAQLDRDPERLRQIRRDNVRHSARRHDWGHRLRQVFERFGLPPTAAMLEREARLEAIAVAAERGGIDTD